MDASFFESAWFTYGLLPFLIFSARIIDVTLDTLRIIFISRGNKVVAPILGFFEVLIWLIAITRIMQNLDNFTTYIAYAAGFAVGNYVGLYFEEKLAIGVQVIRIITGKDSKELIHNLRENGFGATVAKAEGKNGPVDIIFLIVQRNIIQDAIAIINRFNPKAFYSIEDVRSLNVDNSKFTSGTKKTSFTPRWMRKGR
ncbi:MAG TPA: DUF2179 domain-containing protein [Bacteroidales bacterium]